MLEWHFDVSIPWAKPGVLGKGGDWFLIGTHNNGRWLLGCWMEFWEDLWTSEREEFKLHDISGGRMKSISEQLCSDSKTDNIILDEWG